MTSGAKDITIDAMVDEGMGKVLFVEVDAYFMDVLLSFFTVNLGTVIFVHGLQSSMGCINKLCQSVTDLGERYVRTGAINLLLFPKRISADVSLCNKDSLMKYYCFCKEDPRDRNNCGYSTCRCGISYKKQLGGDERVFLKENCKFFITDELLVKPITRVSSTFSLLASTGVHLTNNSNLRRVTITVKDQVLDMFKHCLVSTAPLSDAFLPSVHAKDHNSKRGNLIKSRIVSDHSQQTTKATATSTTYKGMITIKLLCDKISNRVLFAEAKEDFVELLLSFLTCPFRELAFVFPESFTCLSNLFRSASDLEVDKYKSDNAKMHLCSNSHPFLDFMMEKVTTNRKLHYLSEDGLLFMVTDDLQITPFSIVSTMSMFQKFNKQMERIEEREVSLDKEKVKKLLVASLTSTMALTTAFLK